MDAVPPASSPVIKDVAGEARKKKISAISSGSACRCIGMQLFTYVIISSVYSAYCTGVMTYPGLMAAIRSIGANSRTNV
jgi:hypothetical protein